MQPNGANKNNEDQAIFSNAGPYLKRPDDTNKPSVIPKIYKLKKLEWVQDYFLQLTAYAIAHNEIYDTNINEGHIFMCSRAGEYQQFDLWPHEFKEWEQEWWNRVYAYYEKHG